MTKNSSGSDLRGELAELVKRRTEIAVILPYEYSIKILYLTLPI